MKKGSEGYLTRVMDTKKDISPIEKTLVVNELIDVFPEELPWSYPSREIEFGI